MIPISISDSNSRFRNFAISRFFLDFAIPRFRDFAILQFRDSAISPFHDVAMPRFRDSAISLFRDFAVPPSIRKRDTSELSREYPRCSIFEAHRQRRAAFATSAPRQLNEPHVCATRGAIWAAGASLRVVMLRKRDFSAFWKGSRGYTCNLTRI